ncbi:transcriptional regulator [Paenibacillus mesophilus]|uniref:Rrf2 family transcriptional regulator n=1 Tax=Paenibacillus mesophilus TaxID=2582849 RepID=UPI00110E7ABB|nr:Rrf2 family transcriptional regulator [Paenibacillus mesophilus]TMV50901.1 transcriptional regulator [Paenibacillus mesophilus]
MAINSRFAVGVHILSLLEINKEGRNTSEYIAGSVNTNPVVVRRITGMLSKAGLVRTSPGVAGATLARPIGEITLYDVYRAVRDDEADPLFAVHDKPNPDCTVGKNIQYALEKSFNQAQTAMENELAGVTLDRVIHDILQRGT